MIYGVSVCISQGHKLQAKEVNFNSRSRKWICYNDTAADEILRGMEEQAKDSRINAHNHITEPTQGGKFTATSTEHLRLEFTWLSVIRLYLHLILMELLCQEFGPGSNSYLTAECLSTILTSMASKMNSSWSPFLTLLTSELQSSTTFSWIYPGHTLVP